MPRIGGFFNPEELQPEQVLPATHPLKYSQNYRDAVFMVWYQKGKPNPKFLRTLIDNDEYGSKPDAQILRKWIEDEFAERAGVLDGQVMAQINARLVAEKVEMLNRHAEIGREMIGISAEYIRSHESQLTINSSVRLLVAGVEIERDSRGISTTVGKIARMTDDQLDDEIKKLLLSSPVEFEPNDEGVEDEQLD